VRVAPPDDWLEEALGVVLAGGVVALPFERLFGLAADALDPAAVARVLAIKGPGRRGGDRPLAVVIGDLGLLPRIAREFPPAARALADRHWPGPLTLLLPAVEGLPAPLLGPSGLLGVRLPGPCPAAELARAGSLVLTATSANPSGGRDPLDHEDLGDLDGVDLVVPGTVPGPPGSTVVDAGPRPPRVLRRGAIDIGEG